MDWVSSVLPASGVVALFTATATVFIQLLRQNAALAKEREESIATRDKEIDALKLGELRCNRRLDLLVSACRNGGISIPEEVWK